MSAPENEHQEALNILSKHYAVLAKQMAAEIVEHRASRLDLAIRRMTLLRSTPDTFSSWVRYIPSWMESLSQETRRHRAAGEV